MKIKKLCVLLISLTYSLSLWADYSDYASNAKQAIFSGLQKCGYRKIVGNQAGVQFQGYTWIFIDSKNQNPNFNRVVGYKAGSRTFKNPYNGQWEYDINLWPGNSVEFNNNNYALKQVSKMWDYNNGGTRFFVARCRGAVTYNGPRHDLAEAAGHQCAKKYFVDQIIDEICNYRTFNHPGHVSPF